MLTGTYPFAAPDTLDALCAAQPERVRAFFARLDLALPALAAVRDAVDAGDFPRAGALLLGHYREPARREAALRVAVAALGDREVGGQLALSFDALSHAPAPGVDTRDWAEPLLADIHTNQGLAALHPRGADGHLVWRDFGPRGDIEWAFSMNRHRCLVTLLAAWTDTGNPRYAEAIDALLADWLLANPTPASLVHDPVWRELEVGLRLNGPWPLAFAALQDCTALRPVTRLLMLMSIAEQGDYLQAHHSAHPNHLLMEMAGLAMAARCWPECAHAETWLRYAVAQTSPQIHSQFYPDGVQNELTAGYHLVSLSQLELFARIVGNDPRVALPAEFRARLEAMWDYLAYSLRPDGTIPLNNDTDLVHLAGPLMRMARDYARPDWAGIATHGAEGRLPDGLPSVFYPWAGQMIMRDGWGAHDHWGFLDVGPLGVSGHQHRDKLHLGIFAGGRDLLVDSGRYWYKPEVFRQYVLGTHGHNCLMIDGSGQNDDVETVDAPFDGPAMVTEAFDFCRGSFSAGYLGKSGLAEHTRAVLYLRGKCWIVVDRLRTDRPRTVQALWHFHPDCTVTTDGPDVLTVDPGLGNLRITPVAAMPWRLDLVRGATDPDDAHYRMWKVDIVREPDDPGVQGWYSPQYNEIAPSTCVVYRADGLDSATFAWIIAPAVGDVPAVHVEALALDETHARLRVTLDGETWEVAVPLEGMAPPAL